MTERDRSDCDIPSKCGLCGEHTWCENSFVIRDRTWPGKLLIVLMLLSFSFGGVIGYLVGAK